MSATKHSTIDHLFRHAYAGIVAALTSKYSPGRIDLIEDAVQEALYKAMRTWPYGEQPENPTGWLYRVANNHLLDTLRREAKSVALDPAIPREDASSPAPEPQPDGALADGQLKMIFACCHPALSVQDQLILSLKLLGGLSTQEIARALFRNADSVKRAITRAKERFRKEVGNLEVPVGEGLRTRLDAVLKVLYLMFNEGYKAAAGEALIRKDVCEEAIRLGLLLYRHPACSTPDLKALLALMCFHTSRFDARLDDEGELVTLENQDRSRWDEEYIRAGKRFLYQAAHGVAWSQYHLLAAIAAHYATATDFAAIDWRAILGLYDHLMQADHSPVVALNRAVVLGKVEGPEAALEALDELACEEIIRKNHLYYAIRADLESARGRAETAAALLEEGMQYAANLTERRFLEKKAARIRPEKGAG